jgi:hypothetical protein
VVNYKIIKEGWMGIEGIYFAPFYQIDNPGRKQEQQ